MEGSEKTPLSLVVQKILYVVEKDRALKPAALLISLRDIYTSYYGRKLDFQGGDYNENQKIKRTT